MSGPSHDPQLTTGIIAGEVALAAAAGGAASPPEWIKVTPRGPAKTRDGRTYTFNPEALAARFKADGVELPADTDHSTIHKGAKGEKPDTVGHATAIEARPDGTYARMDWLDSGVAVLKARTHRYVSPTFHHDADGNATWLHSIALVSAPALGGMPALAQVRYAEDHHPENPMKKIAKALGLAEDANEDACVSALSAQLQARTEVKPLAAALGLGDTSDAAACLAAIGTLRTTGNATLAETQATLAATTARLAAVEKGVRDKEVSGLLEGALKARKIVPAQREHYLGLCSTDAGLAGVRALLAATADGLQASGLEGQPLQTGDPKQDPATLAADARKLVNERAAAGETLDYAEAVLLVSSKKA